MLTILNMLFNPGVMMKAMKCHFAWALVFAIVTSAAPACAEGTGEGKLDELFNEEAVKALLDEAEPDTAFLVRLNMMRAHVKAAADFMALGKPEEARVHISHPRTEIYQELAGALRERGLPDLAGAMNEAEAAFASADQDRMKTAVAALLAGVNQAEASIAPDSGRDNRIYLDAAAQLLRTAVVEYNEAFEYGKISKVVEYHDGLYFAAEARKLIESMAPAYAARNATTWSKLQMTLAELEKAWPPEAPPAQSILPVTKMQALVSIIELQINRLH